MLYAEVTGVKLVKLYITDELYNKIFDRAVEKGTTIYSVIIEVLEREFYGSESKEEQKAEQEEEQKPALEERVAFLEEQVRQMGIELGRTEKDLAFAVKNLKEVNKKLQIKGYPWDYK